MRKFVSSWLEHRLKPNAAVPKELPQNETSTNLKHVEDLKSGERSIRQELLRQARWSFNYAIFTMAVSSAISIAGIGLLLAGKVKEGTVTAIGGLTSYIVPANCLRLTEKANDRIDKMLKKSE